MRKPCKPLLSFAAIGWLTGIAAAVSLASPPAIGLYLAQASPDIFRGITGATDDLAHSAEPPEPDIQPEDDALAARNAAARSREATLEQELAQARSRLDALSTAGLPESRPYSFSLLETARDELAVEQENLAGAEAAVATARRRVEAAREALDGIERKRRQVSEDRDKTQDDSTPPELTTKLAALEASSRDAKSELKVEQQELANKLLALKIEQLRVQALAQRLAIIEQDAALTRRDLLSELDALNAREAQLRKNIEPTQAKYDQSQQAWQHALAALDTANEGDKPELAAEVELHRTEMRLQQQRLMSFDERIDFIEAMRVAWNRRFFVITGKATLEQSSEWGKATEKHLDLLQSEADACRLRIEGIRRDILLLDNKLASATPPEEDVAKMLRARRQSLSALVDVHTDDLALIQDSQRLHEKLQNEIFGTAAGPGERLSQAWSWFKGGWNYELTSVNDRPITVRKIVIGLLLFVLGVFLARWLSRIFGRRVLTGLKFHASAIAALQAVTFYVLLTIFTLFALHVANVPLTVFTILGGAVALGVGFGSQNIMNNFISGLIILAERPIRVGDMIETDGMIATVERIGARSTVIRTGTNLELIVPNSKFLENNVINWTLSDDRIRTTVTVGVAYGSPTAKVAQLLRRAADEHQLILPEPEPFVLFSNFGDNALQFDLYLWVRSRTLIHRLRIESDLRFQIDALFREAGITIAFPQRDVHVDSLSPLAVRILEPVDSPSNPPDTSP